MARVKTQEVSRMDPIEFTILTQPASKANSRRLVVNRGIPRFIKSAVALRYERDFALQCPQLDPLFLNDVIVEMEIYYASRKPDLDESLILDCCQGRIYRNDRQVVEKHIWKHIDGENPRSVVRVRPVASGHRAGGN